jgi:hypothetical protein
MSPSFHSIVRYTHRNSHASPARRPHTTVRPDELSACQPVPHRPAHPIPSHLRGRRPTPQGLERNWAPRSDRPRQGRTARATGPPPGLKVADPTFRRPPRWSVCLPSPIQRAPAPPRARCPPIMPLPALPLCSRSNHAIHPRRDLRQDLARLNNGIPLAETRTCLMETHGRSTGRAVNLQRRGRRSRRRGAQCAAKGKHRDKGSSAFGCRGLDEEDYYSYP